MKIQWKTWENENRENRFLPEITSDNEYVFGSSQFNFLIGAMSQHMDIIIYLDLTAMKIYSNNSVDTHSF